MSDKIKVLFVCTGNIFRSMSAEYCMKLYLQKNNLNNFEVSSAGIEDIPFDDMRLVNKEELLKLGINPTGHEQRVLTKEMVIESDLVIAMAIEHQEFIKNNFGLDVPLFNELVVGTKTSVLDVDDVVDDLENDIEGVNLQVKRVVSYLYEKMSDLVLVIPNYC